ncbi:MAG: hypothetical protein ACK4FV_03475 [Candidatus Nitrosocaldus sp.]
MIDISILAGIIYIATLLGLWIIISIPVYISAKILTAGRVRFIHTMGATALGPILYTGVMLVSAALLSDILGTNAIIPAMVLAFLAWLWVYKNIFKTSWKQAFGIALLALIVFIGIMIIFLLVMAIIMIPLLGEHTPMPEPIPFPYPQI